MQSISQIRALLDQHGLRPRRRFGQNFLHDKNQLDKLIDAAGVAHGDLVLEVGPGTGTLTEALLDAGAEVIACEIDRGLAQIIEDRFGDRITLVVGDCLQRGRALNAVLTDHFRDRPFKLVANLPYQIASPLIAALLMEHPNCTGQYVTIQKEVADRLLAAPGGKDYGPLGIIVQALGEVRRIAIVKPASFWPIPKVTSAMVSVLPSPTWREAVGEGDAQPAPGDDPTTFARFVTTLFTKRRKQLGTIFGRDLSFPEGITPDLRPEALTVAQLIALWRFQAQ